jgi:Cu/Ag efflux protein CusF
MKKTILLVALITFVAFVSGVMAQQKPATAPAPAAPATTPKPAPPAKVEKFSGDIKSVDAMAKSIVVAKGKEEKTFGLTADTKIMKGNEALKIEDLKAGMNVVIEAKKEGDKLIGSAIKVSAPKAAPGKK